MTRVALGALLAVVLLAAGGGARAEPVRFAVDDGTVIHAQWLPASGAPVPRPAVVALHGCGGLYARDGKTLQERYRDDAARLNGAGFDVLLPDSFGSRGAGPIGAIANAERRITIEACRADAIAAAYWLQRRPGADARRIVLLGWSNGATTALAAINAARPAARALALQAFDAFLAAIAPISAAPGDDERGAAPRKGER